MFDNRFGFQNCALAMPDQYCFIPKTARDSGDVTHAISSAALRCDGSIVVEIQGTPTETSLFPRPQQIALCNGGLFCLDELGLLYHWQGVMAPRQWTRHSSLPGNASIASISCFENGALFVVADDATAFVRSTANGNWQPYSTDLLLRHNAHNDSSESDLESLSDGSKVKPKRRIQFSLRTAMLGMAAIALIFGPLNYLLTSHRIRIAVDLLEAQGNQIQFAHQFDSAGKLIPNASPPEPKWIDQLFGPRLMHRPVKFEQIALGRGQQLQLTPVDERSLFRLTTLKHVVLRDLDDYDCLANLTNLEGLDFRLTDAKDLNFVSNMKNLRALRIGGSKNELDLTPLAALPNLEVFTTVGHVNLAVSRCKNLRELSASFEDTDEMQEIIAPLTGLQKLSADCRAKDLKWVTNYPELKSLKLTSYGAIKDFGPLLQLKHLEELELPINDVKFDFALFAAAPKLTPERVTLSAASWSSKRGGFPIVSPDRLELHLTNATEIPPTVRTGSLEVANLNKNISDLSRLKGAILEEFQANGSRVSDLSVLSGMPLERVLIDGTAVTDISPIANPKLYELKINDTQVADLEPLRGLSLQVLEAANTPIDDVSMLGTLSYSLNISGTKVEDVSVLKNAKLSTLNISRTPVKSLPNSGRFKELSKLDLSHTQIDDISVVSKMTNLEELFLQGSRVSDISVVNGLGKLKEIDASDTLVDRIPSLSNLNYVRMNRTKISDVSPLVKNGDRLYSVWLSGTPVTNISSLVGMGNLNTLDVSHTPLTDLSPLNQTDVRSVDLSGCKATDFSVLKKMPRLERLRMVGLPINKIPQLHHEADLYELDLTATNVKDLAPLFRHEYLKILKLPKSAEFSPKMIEHWPRMLTLVVDGKTIVDKKSNEWQYNPFRD